MWFEIKESSFNLVNKSSYEARYKAWTFRSRMNAIVLNIFEINYSGMIQYEILKKLVTYIQGGRIIKTKETCLTFAQQGKLGGTLVYHLFWDLKVPGSNLNKDKIY